MGVAQVVICYFQAEENIFHVLYFVSSVRDISKINWKKEFFNTTDMADLPVSDIKLATRLSQASERTLTTLLTRH